MRYPMSVVETYILIFIFFLLFFSPVFYHLEVGREGGEGGTEGGEGRRIIHLLYSAIVYVYECVRLYLGPHHVMS